MLMMYCIEVHEKVEHSAGREKEPRTQRVFERSKRAGLHVSDIATINTVLLSRAPASLAASPSRRQVSARLFG